MGPDMGKTIESWRIYREFLRSDNHELIATALAISTRELEQLLSSDQLAREAAEAATEDRLPACLEGLDDSAKAVWASLSGKDTPEDIKQQALLAVAHNGKRAQQQLFVFGLSQNHFDVNAALRALKISQNTYRKWLKEAEFAELICGIQDAKRQFVEGKLFQLVAHGSEKATIFACERLNREDYGAKLELTGTVDHQHSNLDLSILPMELRVQVIEALQARAADPDGLLINSIPAESVKRLS